jgi:hypothetical protein
MVGLRLAEVRYVDIDYHGIGQATRPRGPRHVMDEAEWRAPSWRYPGCDSVDYGVELTMTGGRTFTVTWDRPGWAEGIGVREQPLMGFAVIEGADVAVWDVSGRSRWASLVGLTPTEVVMHYRPDTQPIGFWCSRITINFDDRRVELMLGQGERDGTVAPSFDNIAVIFDENALPAWERDR